MHTLKNITRILFILLILATIAVPAQAKKEAVAYQTGFDNWRAADGGFASWTMDGVETNSSGELTINSFYVTLQTDPYAAGAYYGMNFYTGGSYWVGEAISPAMTPDFPFTEAIASWNAETPPGTWIETLISVKVGDRWSKWYNLGVWASNDTITRHSVRLQGDADAYVATDTLVMSKKVTASAYQLKLRLFSVEGIVYPIVRNVSLAYSTTPEKPREFLTGDSSLWSELPGVPECSQMVYPDGGNVWCSPTSTSMVLGFWGFMPGNCELRVRAAVAGVYDIIYDGHGNWPFNTAYAASLGYEAYVVRFSSMTQVEPWVAAGVPVVVSYAWNKGDLTGAAVSSSNGHLSVIVGFDDTGNPIVNDPAAAADAGVQRTYERTEFESIWLEHSGGTSYLIFPEGHTVPAVIP